MKLVYVGIVALFLVYFVDHLNIAAWSVWTYQAFFQKGSVCYTQNDWFVKLFSMIEKRDLNLKYKIPATSVVEINAADYSFKALEVLSKSWTQPVIVRGLFGNASALTKWSNPDYLIDHTFHSSLTSVIHNGTIIKHYERICGKEEGTFSEYKPFDETIRRIAEESSTVSDYIFP